MSNRAMPLDASQVHATKLDGFWICTVMTHSKWQFAGHGETLQDAFQAACNNPPRDMTAQVSPVPPMPEPENAA